MRDLSPLLRPRSIAMIGASSDPRRGNGRTLRYLIEGGYAGPVYPVNPNRSEVQGLRAYTRIEDVPGPVDAAIVAVPAAAAVQAVQACAEAGVRSAIVYAAGFAEAGEGGRELQARLVEAACRTCMPVLGPNSLGAFDARSRSFMTFSSMFDDGYPEVGRIGMVTQSELLRLSMSALGGGPAESSIQQAIEQRTFVAQVMVRNPPTLAPDDTLAEAAHKLVATRAGALAVVESDGRLVGILSEIDVLKVAMAYL